MNQWKSLQVFHRFHFKTVLRQHRMLVPDLEKASEFMSKKPRVSTPWKTLHSVHSQPTKSQLTHRYLILRSFPAYDFVRRGLAWPCWDPSIPNLGVHRISVTSSVTSPVSWVKGIPPPRSMHPPDIEWFLIWKIQREIVKAKIPSQCKPVIESTNHNSFKHTEKAEHGNKVLAKAEQTHQLSLDYWSFLLRTVAAKHTGISVIDWWPTSSVEVKCRSYSSIDILATHWSIGSNQTQSRPPQLACGVYGSVVCVAKAKG